MMNGARNSYDYKAFFVIQSLEPRRPSDNNPAESFFNIRNIESYSTHCMNLADLKSL